MKNTSIVLSIFAMLAVVGMIVTAADVRAATWIGSDDNDKFNNTSNWDTDYVPTGGSDTKYITTKGSTVNFDYGDGNTQTVDGDFHISGDNDPDADTYDWQVDWSGAPQFNVNSGTLETDYNDLYLTESSASTNAEFNINDGGKLDAYGTRGYIGQSGNKGTVNVKSGGELATDNNADWYLGAADSTGGTGVINVEDGGKAVFGRSLYLNQSGGGTGKVNIGGDFQVNQLAPGSNDGPGTTEVTVEGTWDEFGSPGTAGTFTVGTYDVKTADNNSDLLRFLVDGTGVTTMQVTGDVTFQTNSELDAGFLGSTTPREGDWTAMTWDGSITNEGDFGWADGTAPDGWSYNLNTTDKELIVSYVPEPSSLALLLVGAMVLFQRRRRRE